MPVCNAVINYWDESRDFLNDFKHVFRVIPFTCKILDWLYENDLITADIDLEEVRANYSQSLIGRTISGGWTSGAILR